MNPLAAGGFRERVVAVRLEVLPDPEGELDDVGERVPFRGIEVDDEVVGVVEAGPPRVQVMDLDAGVVGDPDHRGLVGGEHVVEGVARFSDHLVIEPRRRPLGAVLLEEALAVDAVRVAHERQRPPPEMGEDGRGDLQVVLDQLRLEDAVMRPQHLVEVGDLELVLADLGQLCFSRHRRRFGPRALDWER